MLSGLLTLAASGGCQFNVTVDGATYACSDGVCPTGYTCDPDTMMCVRPGTDADAAVPGHDAPLPADAAADAPPGAPDAAVVAATCAQPSLLKDDFNGTSVTRSWRTWADPGVVVSVGAGHLVVATTGSGNRYGGIGSESYYDLRGGRFSVQVATTTALDTTAQTIFELVDPDNRKVQILEESGLLVFRLWPVAGGNYVDVDQISYDAVAHRFWQLREADGTLSFETSADGTSFVARAQTADPFDLANVRVGLAAGTYRTVSGGGAAAFDLVNGGGAPEGTWCASATLTDDFADGTRGPQWGNWYADSGCAITEGSGALSLTPDGTVDHYCGYGTSRRYDLRESSFTLRLRTPAPAGVNEEGVVELRDVTTDKKIVFDQDGDTLFLSMYGGGTTWTDFASTPFDPIQHRYLRWTEHAGTLTWQTSPDGIAWTTQVEQADPIDLSGLEIYLSAGVYASPSGTLGTVRFSNVNP